MRPFKNNHEHHSYLRNLCYRMSRRRFVWIHVFGVPVFLRPMTFLERELFRTLVDVLDHIRHPRGPAKEDQQ